MNFFCIIPQHLKYIKNDFWQELYLTNKEMKVRVTIFSNAFGIIPSG